jgi:two-component system alkaline phosphatase synthesis response regulator PhoP
MAETILLVEDEMRIARWTQTYIEKAGYGCIWASNGKDALHLARCEQPDLIVLDLMLPEVDGWTVCEHLRQESDVPIIMLTAKVAEHDVIHGLKLGADDYVKKPFSPDELIARIEATLRRANGKVSVGNRLVVGTLTLDLESRECFLRDERISLTNRQFELLRFFMLHPQQVLSREQLIINVFGEEYDSFERAIDIHIRRLRTKIEHDPSNPTLIQTVFGVGYRYCPEDA